MKIVSALLIIAAFSLLATGCNTIRGAGRDIQRGGRAIQEMVK
ncbi:MAG TPA: entericidin A/B family lipoprotein [Candidatus Hydrogenedentes bacterium]|nr:entericidin A/B family lipoprotein [Candidatus Hydrogenedentota bacterium]